MRLNTAVLPCNTINLCSSLQLAIGIPIEMLDYIRLAYLCIVFFFNHVIYVPSRNQHSNDLQE